MKIIISSIIDVNRAANNRLHQFIDHLSEAHEITVVCPRDSWRDSQTNVSEYESNDAVSKENVKYIYLSESSFQISPILQEVFSEILLSIDSELDYSRYDVHLDYNTLLLGLAIDRRVRKHNIPTVYDLADDLPAMIRESPQIPRALGPIGERVGNKIIQRKITNAKKISYITEGLRQDMGVSSSRSHHIPNGVDSDSFTPDVSKMDIEGWKKEFNIGYVGVTREWVDLTKLVQAVAQLRSSGTDAGLIIVGDEGGTDDAVHEAERLGIQEHCHFAGTVPYKSVPHYINSFDVGTIPFREGDIAENSLPLKLFEYMACHVPVVSSSIPGVEDAAGDLVGFTDSVEEWTEELAYLANNPDRRRELGEKGRFLVENSYSWDAIGEQMEVLLVETAESRSAMFSM